MFKFTLFKYLMLHIGKIGQYLHKEIENPFFIIGTGRCGTGLLLKILKSHRQIATYPSEANELWHPHSFSIKKFKIDTPPILINPKEFTMSSTSSWPQNQKDIIKSIFTGYFMLRMNKKIFLQKSAMISFMVPTIQSIFPNAKFIHIYRNPISVVASLEKKEWHKHSHLFSNKADFRLICAQYWEKCIFEIDRQNQINDNGAFFELSYESLCNDPTSQLQSLANFMECSSNGFEFDLSQIKSTNYKVGNYPINSIWTDIVDIILPTMKKKGYSL